MFSLLLWSSLALAAQTTISKEYQIKAIFLFNFAQFVDWPANAFSEAETPLTIGILGDDPFGTFLDETVQGEKVNGHPLIVQHYQRVEDIKTCHILFISQSETKHLKRILNGLKDRNLLTVSDTDNFTKYGGIIQFVTEQNKIHFQINLEAAKEAELTISSKLLRLAKIVGPEKN